MANWSNPTITTNYDVFVNEAKDRDVDVATMFLNDPINPPVGAIRLYRPVPTFRQYTGSSFQDFQLSVNGGGTGSNTPVGARANLGIGTMGTQNDNAVNISGGNITINYLGLHTSIYLAADATYDLGSSNYRFRNGYFRNALVIPVGVDKFATS